MVAQHLPQRQASRHVPVWSHIFVLLGCLLFLIRCNPGGDTGTPPADLDPADPQFVRQGVMEVLTLYRTAVVQEDIDRLQALLQTDTTPLQAGTRLQPRARSTRGMILDAQTFRTVMSTTFRTLTVTELQLPAEAIQIAPDYRRVTFLEVESVEDAATLMQQTRLYRTTFQLTQTVTQEVVTFRISAVQREGPLVQVTTRGQVQAGALTRVEVYFRRL